MAHLHNLNPDGTTANPTSQPAPGKDGRSQRDQHPERYRSPDAPTERRDVQQYELVIVPDAPPMLEPVGVQTRPPRAPSGAASDAFGLRPWAAAQGYGSLGLHGEAEQGSAQPRGEQAPLAPRGNSRRLPPQPWDADIIVGLDT